MPLHRPAAFLDRDGTLLIERNYLARPEDVVLAQGAADALRALALAGFTPVIITNQSGIARGLYTEADYQSVQQRLNALLEQRGIEAPPSYHCPHHPDFTGECDCRKPAVGLYLRAAAELGLDLRRSLYVGDRLRDIQPARTLGGTGILVRTGYGAREEPAVPRGSGVVADLADLAARVARGEFQPGAAPAARSPGPAPED